MQKPDKRSCTEGTVRPSKCPVDLCWQFILHNVSAIQKYVRDCTGEAMWIEWPEMNGMQNIFERNVL